MQKEKNSCSWETSDKNGLEMIKICTKKSLAFKKQLDVG